MGSGIVFSVGGLSSEQDLQRLRREEEMGEDKEREGRRFNNNIHQCHLDIFQPLVHIFSTCFPITVVRMYKVVITFFQGLGKNFHFNRISVEEPCFAFNSVDSAHKASCP